ncbi:hypothetical protein [Bosea beijingensis]|uniref:hypothetical protein n=1 Tax=Bosea beijingensis TaxID=3068632 RepID=UPI002741875B|nr:hypothetical protein [Bosea sp. REN20]
MSDANVDSNESGKMPYLKKQRRTEILAELKAKFQDGATFNTHTVLELYPEFRNYHRAFEFLSAAVQRDELKRMARGEFAFGSPPGAAANVEAGEAEERQRRPRLLKARRIEIFSGLAARFPHPKPFTYDDMLTLFPEVGPRNNVYSIVAAAIERGDLVRLEDNRLAFSASFVPAPLKAAPELPVDEYMAVVDSVGQRYSKPKLLKVGDILRPAEHFRTAIYGENFDLGTPSELYPRCVVIDLLDDGSSDDRVPPFDILVCYLDSNHQAHVKAAGSWQFDYFDSKGA